MSVCLGVNLQSLFCNGKQTGMSIFSLPIRGLHWICLRMMGPLLSLFWEPALGSHTTWLGTSQVLKGLQICETLTVLALVGSTPWGAQQLVETIMGGPYDHVVVSQNKGTPI